MTRAAADESFDTLLSSTPAGPGRLAAELPGGWVQGRGLYGGLVTGVMVRALEGATPGRPLRSLTAELCGPLQPGPVEVQLEVLRAGSAVTTTTVRLVQEGAVQAHGVGVLGAARPVAHERVDLAKPPPGDWRALDPLEMGPPMAPVFTRFFEYRATAHLPLSGGQEPVTEGWVRPRARARVRDAAFLAGCVDAWWPALFSVADQLHPVATIAFTFQPFVRFEGLDPEAPLFHRARMLAISEGYCVEQRELWGADGRLLALNQQTMVVIK